MPIHVFSVLQAYPEAFVRFILLEPLNACVGECFEHLRSCGFTRFDVIEKKPLGLPGYPDGMYERWLLPKSYFADFKYVWLGDVDFLHYLETPTWLEQELAACADDGFPYSNVVREGIFSDCMTGWHFFEVEPYFEKMGPVIESYIASPVSMQVSGTNPLMANERLLYHLVKAGIGVKESSDLSRRHRWRMTHGIHLGMYRIGERMPEWMRLDPWRGLIQAQLFHPVFVGLMCRIKHPEMMKIFAGLRMDYGRMVKLL